MGTKKQSAGLSGLSYKSIFYPTLVRRLWPSFCPCRHHQRTVFLRYPEAGLLSIYFSSEKLILNQSNLCFWQQKQIKSQSLVSRNIMLNFIVLRNIHFINIFVLNVIICFWPGSTRRRRIAAACFLMNISSWHLCSGLLEHVKEEEWTFNGIKPSFSAECRSSRTQSVPSRVMQGRGMREVLMRLLWES